MTTTGLRAGARTAGRIAARTLSWLLFLAGLACLVGAVWWATEARTDDGADIAGYRPYLVATGSMAPGYEVNSFVLTHDSDFADVEEGDVVAFRAAGIGGAPALHRVVHISRDASGAPVSFVVKGDNNPHPDGAPVTRDNYLGRTVFHTNATAFVWDQAQGPHGLLRVVVLPAVLLLLVWLGSRLLFSGRRTVLGRTLVAAGIAFCLLASATVSYALYLDKEERYVSTTLDTYATAYERQPAGRTTTIQGAEVEGTIDIPSIDVHYPIIEYVAASSLNVAITHYEGPRLNHEGNVVLAGHHAWDNLYFTRIDRLEKGDIVWITGANQDRVEYVVTGHRQVSPDDLSVLRQTHDGKHHLTLVSCTYDLRNRYIVDAVAAADLPGHPTAVRTSQEVEDAGIWPDHSIPAAIGLAALGAVGTAAWALAERRRRSDAADVDESVRRPGPSAT